jgi:tetratricopeptide (TPR) repeat protein
VLFDLRSSGRRRTIKVIYLTLALLMGGGLILFGIGGGTSLNGGLFDAFSGNSGGGGSVDDRFKKQETALVAKVRANPQDAAAYAQLARVRFQLAGSGDQYDPNTNQYTNEGKAQLRQATAAWQQHLKVAGDNPDPRVATSMVNAYIALGDTDNAVAAQEIVAEDRNAAGQYSTLAILAYQAGQTRKGDLAKDKAIELTPKDQRETVKGQLEQAKQQALGATGGASGSGG